MLLFDYKGTHPQSLASLAGVVNVASILLLVKL